MAKPRLEECFQGRVVNFDMKYTYPRLGERQLSVSYLPIEYRQRKGRSKIVPWDAGSFFILILRTIMLFRPLRVFFPIVVFCLVAGFTKMGIDLSHQPNISASAQLALMSALLVLLIGMLGDAIATRMGRFNPSAIVGVKTDDLSLLDNEGIEERSTIGTENDGTR